MRLSWHRQALLLLVALALLRGAIYAALTPPWQAPDEPRHFEYVKLLHVKRRLLTRQDLSMALQREIVASMEKHEYWRFGYARFPYDVDTRPQSFADIYWPVDPFWLFHPPPYYILGALALFALPKADVDTQLYVVRLISVILGTAVVGIAFLTAETLFPDDEVLAVGIPAFVVFLPAHTFLTSTVNNDHLAELFVSLQVLVLVKSFRNGLSLLKTVLLVLLPVLGLLSKRTALVVIPLTVLALPLYVWRPGSRLVTRSMRVVAGVGVTILGITLALLFRSVWQPLLPERLFGLLNWLPIGYAGLIIFRRGDLTALLASIGMSQVVSYGSVMFETFWARFGWLNVRLGTLWYQVLAIVSVVAISGVGLLGVRVTRNPGLLTPWQKKGLLLFFLGAVLAVAVIVVYRVALSAYYVTIGFGELALPQGRYLYPVIIPLATLFMVGLRELVPIQYRKLWLMGCIGGLVMLDLVSMTHYVIPFYYG